MVFRGAFDIITGEREKERERERERERASLGTRLSCVSIEKNEVTTILIRCEGRWWPRITATVVQRVNFYEL